MKISVIIPTFNRKALLQGCLASVLAQERPADEIIVADNASSDGTSDCVPAGFSGRVELVREAAPGVSHARNRGIARASGDVLAFIDDDAVAAPDWLGAVERCFTQTDAAGTGGPALPLWEVPPPRAISGSRKAMSYISAFDPGGARRRLSGPRDFLIGTNCAFRREVFAAGHLFRSIYAGSKRFKVGEDYEFSRRVAAAFPVFYDPAIKVYHRIPAFKTSLRYLAATGFENGRMKAAIGGRLTPRGPRDVWGVDGWISAFSLAGYFWGLMGRATGLAAPRWVQ
jgi:glycosyltransferase involved in cell wall biosynthesis